MTSVVVFDLGGVLCRFDPEARIRALAAASGWSAERIREHVWRSGRDADADAGRLGVEEAFALASLDGAVDHDTVVRSWEAAFSPDESVLALVDRVLARCAVLTNNGPVVEELFTGRLELIARRCDPVLLSWRLGATKPSLSAYERAAERIGAAAPELFFVDDSSRNVDGARAAGWDAMRFTTADALERELSTRDLLAPRADVTSG